MPAPAPRGATAREVIAFFGSLKLAIVLLLAVAAASVVGTVIPQDQGQRVIEEGAFAPWLKAVLVGIQAHDVYHAAWFLTLLALLFVNLAVCTWLRFPPTWKRYRLSVPPAPATTGLAAVHRLAGGPDKRRLDALRKRGWRVVDVPGEVYAEKHKFSRLSATFIHLSLFLIIAGAIWGGLAGMKHSLPLQVGQATDSRAIWSEAYQRGRLSAAPPPFELRLDAFRMEFRPSGAVKQYYSDVTVLPRDGRPAYSRTLWVNEPLIVDGMYFYQSFWGVGAVSWAIDGRPERQALTQAKTGGYMSRPFRVGARQYMLFLRSLDEAAMLVDTREFQPRAEVVPGLPVALDGHQFALTSYHLYSGLETKVDPGIPLVYLGCGFMLLGLALLPFRHCEAWIRQDATGWLIGGRAHRGRVVLQRELAQLAGGWNRGVAPDPASLPTGASAL
ncbi:MAG: cytochrome c biogenesis protein ResB [Candidatus Sericytochromatia bacterium]|nr:cytochrome c biogenesis protein ResB [Candidatus Sericytochromatia bacterium]